MQALRTSLLCALLFAGGCTGAPRAQDTQSAARESPPTATQPASTTQAADATAALGELEPLTRADVELYLKVMRTAAQRLKNLPAADRDAIKTFHRMTTTPNDGRLPPPEEIAAMQRAGDLMSLDGVVAREIGVARRYRSIASRVPMFGMPEMSGSGDDDPPPMTAEQKREMKLRMERLRQRRKLDMATLAPYRDEIQSLQKQVDLITHPESIPQDDRPY